MMVLRKQGFKRYTALLLSMMSMCLMSNIGSAQGIINPTTILSDVSATLQAHVINTKGSCTFQNEFSASTINNTAYQWSLEKGSLNAFPCKDFNNLTFSVDYNEAQPQACELYIYNNNKAVAQYNYYIDPKEAFPGTGCLLTQGATSGIQNVQWECNTDVGPCFNLQQSKKNK